MLALYNAFICNGNKIILKTYFKNVGHTDWLQTVSLFFLSQMSQAHVTRVESDLLSHKRVGVELQVSVETLYEK